MQVSYKILVVTRSMKIKHNKNRVVSVVSFTQLHPLTDIVSHQCSTANTQITNFFISGTSTAKMILFQIFGLYLHFFLELMETHLFWARPFKIAQAFSLPLDYFFGCVLEETHGTPNVEVERKS